MTRDTHGRTSFAFLPATLRHKLLNRFPKPKENLHHFLRFDRLSSRSYSNSTQVQCAHFASSIKEKRNRARANPTATTFPYTGFRQTCVKGERWGRSWWVGSRIPNLSDRAVSFVWFLHECIRIPGLYQVQSYSLPLLLIRFAHQILFVFALLFSYIEILTWKSIPHFDLSTLPTRLVSWHFQEEPELPYELIRTPISRPIIPVSTS